MANLGNDLEKSEDVGERRSHSGKSQVDQRYGLSDQIEWDSHLPISTSQFFLCFLYYRRVVEYGKFSSLYFNLVLSALVI